MESTPIREIKPVVVPAQFYVWGPIISSFISLFPGFFVFVISNIITQHFDAIYVYGISAFIFSFIICMVLFGIKVFKEPERTTYAIFPDRVEYDEGLWNRHRRTVIFDQVIDVELTEGVLQQTQGAGTITLVTHQLISQGKGQLTNRRVALTNVSQPKEVYDLLRSLALKKNGT